MSKLRLTVPDERHRRKSAIRSKQDSGNGHCPAGEFLLPGVTGFVLRAGELACRKTLRKRWTRPVPPAQQKPARGSSPSHQLTSMRFAKVISQTSRVCHQIPPGQLHRQALAASGLSRTINPCKLLAQRLSTKKGRSLAAEADLWQAAKEAVLPDAAPSQSRPAGNGSQKQHKPLNTAFLRAKPELPSVQGEFQKQLKPIKMIKSPRRSRA